MSTDSRDPHALTDSAAHMEQPAQEIDWDIDDQTVVYVGEETWDFFVSALDHPVENAGFRKLMQAPCRGSSSPFRLDPPSRSRWLRRRAQPRST